MREIITTKTKTELEGFYTELLKDSVLQDRITAATDPESLSELVVELGKAKGFFFTKEEVSAAMAIEAAMGGEYVEEVTLSYPSGTNSPKEFTILCCFCCCK